MTIPIIKSRESKISRDKRNSDVGLIESDIMVQPIMIFVKSVGHNMDLQIPLLIIDGDPVCTFLNM
jgi:hypothetical protein